MWNSCHVVYVDDVIIIGDCEEDIDQVKGLLKAKFNMKDLGELMYFLGIEVIQTAGSIWLFAAEVCARHVREVWDDRM